MFASDHMIAMTIVSPVLGEPDQVKIITFICSFSELFVGCCLLNKIKYCDRQLRISQGKSLWVYIVTSLKQERNLG